MDSVIRHIQDLEDEYSAFSTTQTVYIPVVGLSLLRPELVLGAVTLLKSTEAVIQTAIESLHRVVDQSPRDENEKKAIKQKFEQQISDNMRDGVFSMFQGVAEPTRALERAEEETRRAIDLLRFVVPAFYPPDQKVVVGLPGEAERVIQWTLVLSDTSFNINRKVVRAIAPFEITDDRIHHMENIGVFEVSRMLRTPERSLNDFEKTILRAIHWFASAQTQDEVENRFLNLITCIETFLTPRDGNPIGTAIAEGLALILGAELETRKRIKRRVQQLYRQRSAVSHGGRKSVLETDFLELESIAGELIVSLIARRNEFNSQKDLLGWIEDRKLG